MWASQLVDWSVSHRNHQTRSSRKRVKDRRTCEAREVVTVWLYKLQRSFPQKKYVTTEWEYMELITLFAPGWFLHPHHARVWSQWSRGSLSDEHINCFTLLPGLQNRSQADTSRPSKQTNMETHHFMPVLCKTSSKLCVCLCVFDWHGFVSLSFSWQPRSSTTSQVIVFVCLCSTVYWTVLLISLRAVNTINNSTRFKNKQRALGAEAEQHTWAWSPLTLQSFFVILSF